VNRYFILLLGVALVIVGISQPCHAGRQFHDNFNRDDVWIYDTLDGRQDNPASSWSVIDGQFVENSGWDAQFALVGNISFSSQTLQAEVEPHPWAGIVFWFKDVNNFVMIVSGYGSSVTIMERIDGIGNKTAYPYFGDKVGVYRVDTNSSTGEIDFYVDDVYVFSHTLETNIRTGLSGLIGGNGGGTFDDFSVTSLGRGKK
jgi:hypothetical protein